VKGTVQVPKSPAVIAIALAAVLAGSPAPASAAARPFPYHVTLAPGVIKPNNLSQAQMDAKISSFYKAWKTNYLRDLGGGKLWVKYDNTNSTVSEAHGWGMVLAAIMADRSVFDSMFQYFKVHPSSIAGHLMAWKQTLMNGRMVSVQGVDSATDGDLDIAYGLLLADTQWGSAGTINYKAEALRVMRDILAYDVNQTTWTLTLGDWATGAHADHTRPSDFMTDHFLAFAKAAPGQADKWNKIYDGVARIVNYQFNHGSQTTGLMPDFMVRSGTDFIPVSGKYLETIHDGDFSYNACRTPWRLSMTYILEGRTEMLAALKTQASWIRSKTGGIPTNIRAGYYVRNGPNGESYVNYHDLAFTAPFAVDAMTGGAASQAWLNSLWSSIAGGDYGTQVNYYGDTIRLQVMLTLAGDWWQP